MQWSRYYWCINSSICISTCCLYPCPLFVTPKLAKSAHTRLTGDAIEHEEVPNYTAVILNFYKSQGFADCCCHVANKKVTIPLENITDVNVTTGCCLSMFGLKGLTF